MKLKAAMAVFGAVMALGVGTASANNGGGQYPPNPGDDDISVDKPVVETGDSITVRARGLCEGTVVFELAGSSTVGLLLSPGVWVNKDGTASYTFTVPGPASDWYVAWAKQPDCEKELKTPVKVVDPMDDDDEWEEPAPTEPIIGSEVNPVDDDYVYDVFVNGLCPGTATITVTGSGVTGTKQVAVPASGFVEVTFVGSDIDDYTVTVTQTSCPTGTKTFQIDNTKKGSSSPAAEPAPAAPSAPAAPVTPAVSPAVVTPAVVAPAVAAPAVIAPAVAAPVAAAPVKAAAGDLPTTGANPASIMQIAAFAMAAGLGMVMVSAMRRRSRKA